VSWELVYYDDFTGYANDAAFQAAYPETAFTVGEMARLVWSATNGPDNVPGVANAIAGGVLSAHFIKELSPQFGPEIRVTGLFDNSDPPSAAQPRRAATIRLYDETDLLTAYTGDGMTGAGIAHGDLRTLWDSDSGATVEVDTSDFPASTTQTLDIRVKLSSGSDGYVQVYVDGTEHVNVTGQIGISNPSAWKYVGVGPGGKFTTLAIYQWVESAPDPDPGELTGSTPEPSCCGGENATGPILPPTGTTWTANCDGGGTVPTAADLTDSENWDD
jgi:hypothetical protein